MSKRVQVMGVLNVTPDSFSDGGLYYSVDAAIAQALLMQQQGADIIDIGGESTRPGAQPVSLQQELERVIPVITALKSELDIPISIDTYKPEVMEQAIQNGASVINDINGLRAEGALAVAAHYDGPICIMHMQNQPQTMQSNPSYNNIIEEICQFFDSRIADCQAAGISRSRLILDPGFGFGKTPSQNLKIVGQLAAFQRFDLPILIGVSRKSTIGHLLNSEPEDCLAGSLAMTVMAINNGANIVRTHDVKQTVDAVKITTAVLNCT